MSGDAKAAARKKMADMDVLEKSIDTLLDSFLEGVEEVAGRLGIDRADTLNVLGRYSKRMRRWMVEHHAMLDAGGSRERADPTDAALLGAVMRQPGTGSGIGGFAATVPVHWFGSAIEVQSPIGVEVQPTWQKLNEEVGILRTSNRLRGERADRERVRREVAERRLRMVDRLLNEPGREGARLKECRGYVAAALRNMGVSVQRMGGATGDAS